MKTNFFKTTAGVAVLGLGGWVAMVTLQAQPMYDRIHVTIPYTVTLQNATLQPGDYTIQQLPSAGGGSRVLLFYSKDGMKFETSAMTIPALELKTQEDTKLILNQLGSDYYISKIWVQGKDYGYELPIPDTLKSRQNERSIESSVKGTYTPTSSTDVTTTSASSTPATDTTTTATTNQADTTNKPMTDTTANTATAAASTATNTTPQTPQATTEPAQTAQNTQPTRPVNPPAATDNSADRSMPDQTPADSNANGSANRSSMPSTSAGWLMMLLSGGTLSGAGMMLRRKR